MINGDIRLKTVILAITLFFSVTGSLSVSQAHILIIGDSQSDFPTAFQETSQLAADLRQRGYPVLDLYRDEATAENILKGMYGADAVIYAGHGGYQTGHYNGAGGTATPPFALTGSDDFIWGIGGQMREGGYGDLFTAPFKENIPVFLLHACFSTGWVEDNQVANPIETIYNFARMFNGAGANYYATAWNGAEIIYDFLNGAGNFQDANNQNYEKITRSTLYNGVQVWRNNNGYSAFVGDWNGKFPSLGQTTAYDESSADFWYHSDRVIRNTLYAVWQDDRDGNAHVYYKDLQTKAGSRVSWIDSQQTNPVISGNIIVWQDNRNGGTHLYYKNLATGQGSRVSWTNSQQTNPSISDNTVVWQDNRDDAGTSHLYYKNLETKTGSRVSWVDSQQTNPSISDNTVVWEDNRDNGNHIYYKNLETKIGNRVSWVDSDQRDPEISDNTVVWEDDRDGGSNVYYKNIETGQGTRVSWVSSEQSNPAIS